MCVRVCLGMRGMSCAAVCVYTCTVHEAGWYAVEPLYKRHAGTIKIVLYTEVSFIQRLSYT